VSAITTAKLAASVAIDITTAKLMEFLGLPTFHSLIFLEKLLAQSQMGFNP
jgi:hypothetical protein